MNKQHILYLYKTDSNFQLKKTLLDELRIRYDVITCDNDQDSLMILKQLTNNIYQLDLVIIQNSQCLTLYKTLLKTLKRVPWIFVSCGYDINNYIAPVDSLYRVFNFGSANMESCCIPREIQTFLKLPVCKKNYFKEKPDEEICRILYYPTDYSLQNAAPMIVSVVDHYKNIALTIVSDSYSIFASVLPTNVNIISRKASIAALKKAHVVLATGYDAIHAMACAVPCIIIGDYGFGGIVTPENYDILKNFEFHGRAGASFGEIIPIDLLNYEIQKSISSGNKETAQLVQKKIIDDYNYLTFSEKVSAEINAVISLSCKIKQKKTMITLKPMLSSILGTENVGTKIYLKRGSIYYTEIDEDLLNVLKQCNGKTTISEILFVGKYDKENTRVICDNLLELWRKKLIIFYE